MEKKKLDLNATAIFFLTFSERIKKATEAMIEFSKAYEKSNILKIKKQ